MFVKGFHYLGESKGDRPLPAVEDQNDLIVKQELKERMAVLSAEIDSVSAKTDSTERFIAVAKKYTNLSELTPAILRELIEKIAVHQAVKENGKRRQTIEIYYDFIGAVKAAK